MSCAQADRYSLGMDSSTSLVGESIDFRDFVRPVWSRRWLILAIAVVGAAATYGFFVRQAPRYTASTKIFFQDASVNQLLNPSAADDPDRNLLNQATLLTSRDVAASVARRIGYKGNARTLLRSVKAQPSTGSDFILVTAEDATAKGAARLANAFAAAFTAIRSQNLREAISRELKAARQRLRETPKTTANSADRADLAGTVRQLQVAQSLPGGTAQQIDPALPPNRADSPRPLRNAVFGFALAVLAGVGVALILERFDRRIRRLSDMPAAYDLPLLGVIPSSEQPAPRIDKRATLAEGLREPFRSLRTMLQISVDGASLRSILLVSALPGEGKSTIVRNLALTYGESGERVAVLDFDLRQPALPRMLGVDRQAGFTDVLAGALELGDALQTVPIHTDGVGARKSRAAFKRPGADEPGAAAAKATTGKSEGSAIQTLSLLNAGTPSANPQTLLATEDARQVLELAQQSHDITLIDSSPVLSVSDATFLLGEVDGVVVVSRVGVSTTAGAKRLVELLRKVPHVRLLGLVVNGADEPGRSYYYGT